MNSTSATSKLTARVHNLVLSSMLLPMHLPVLLCSFLCGGSWGAAVGFAAPLIRSALLGAPAAYPTALAMAFELAAYSLTTGLLYRHLLQTSLGIYASLLAAMVAGRVVWGGIMSLLLMNSDGFTLTAFVVGSFTNAIPGILLQLIASRPS